MQKDVPLGILCIQKLFSNCKGRCNKYACYKGSILFLTFISYMCYHIARKPFSVVRSVLHRNCTNIPDDEIPVGETCSWAPFDQDNAAALFGTLDSAFLFAYAFAMFISGLVAERVNLRYFLALGMILSGGFSYLLGIAKVANIHSLWYFILIQALMGIAQTTGWPAVVSVIGHWFGKQKRGLIFGIWNSHTSLGNILGSFIAAAYVESNWAYSFIIPGLIIALAGFLIFLFLVVNPEAVDCSPVETENNSDGSIHSYSPVRTNEDSESDSELENSVQNEDMAIVMPYRRIRRKVNESSPIIAPEQAVGFMDALKIPGVVEFSLCLFFAKLVSYTFLYWLPLYITSSTDLNAALSGDLSTLFDVGGIVGAVLAGTISDSSNMPATTCVSMLFAAAPTLFIYEKFGSKDLTVNIILLLIGGALVNGPYALITTAVAAELGTHPSLQSNSKALATVTAIIDGTGSIGAAVGPLVASLVSSSGWNNVFYILIASDVVALLLLSRLTYKEIEKCREGSRRSIN